MNVEMEAVAAWQKLRAREKLVEKGPKSFSENKSPVPLSQFMLPQ